MSSKSKHHYLRKIKESNINYNEDIYISSSDDEMAFQYFYQGQIEKDFCEETKEGEKEARALWKGLDINKRKSFLKPSKEGDFESDVSFKSGKCKRSPSPKRMKKENHLNNENNVIVKNENEAQSQLFQMEVQRLVASPAQYSFQPVCSICETHSEHTILQCTSICKRYFHIGCLKESPEKNLSSPSKFQCSDCTSNVYRCILCGANGKLEDLYICRHSGCGRLYHKKCLSKGRFPSMKISDNCIQSCPAHYCITCVREDVSFADESSTKLVECLRCPLSFHCNDLCMAAGASELSLSHVICPRHFEGKLIKMNTYKPFHPAWCFKCFKTGVKLLCHFCPASFHPECADRYEIDSDKNQKVYVCHNCRNYRQPRYGEVLFVKVSQYRWWPCEIIHPRNAPMNILKLSRPDGTYPVLFLGSNEYQWVAKTRSIDYNTAQKSSIFKDTGGTNRMDREFTSGLKSAAKIHQIFVNIIRRYVPLKSISAPQMTEDELHPYINVKEKNQKTLKYKPIKANILVSPAKLPPAQPVSICDCTVSCQLFQCKNYLKRIECQTTHCPAKSKCQNQQFTTLVNKNLAVFKTANRGFGFKTTESIRESEFIIEYVGEIITKSESTVRIHNAKKSNQKDFYMVKLTSDLIIDAGPMGNLSRYINHSCNPNCYLEKWMVNGYPRLGVFALKNIDPDQELTFDYRISGVVMKEDTFCLCNSNGCSGFLGPVKSLPSSPSKLLAAQKTMSSPLSIEISERMSECFVKEENTTKLENEIIKSDISNDESKIIDNESLICQENALLATDRSDESDGSKTVHENFCFRCFDGGNLVLCDKNDCPKTYHLSCLGLESAPSGIWYCPWHFCDVCGHPSHVFCLQCPRSFCNTHAENEKIVAPRTGARLSVCRFHRDSEISSLSSNLDHSANSHSDNISCSSNVLVPS